MIEQSYRFIQNKACIYFPCHNNADLESFNCLFCYCPLYFLEDCHGNKALIDGIKDCSNCMIPHSKNGYDIINQRIIEENKQRKSAQR